MSRPRRAISRSASLAAAALLLAAACQPVPQVEQMRADYAPADAPFDAATLEASFRRIALRHETDPRQAGGPGNWSPNPLRRWNGPLRYQLAGSAVTSRDRAETRSLMQRIARLTGLEVAEAESDVTFLILITAPWEYDHVSARLHATAGPLAQVYELWHRSPEIRCAGGSFSPAERPGNFEAALVTIGAETTGLHRLACLHEEIVQALGLANDDRRARPSIFNDDGEFALLTRHDAFLLRILYDPRLKPGMTEAEAMPVVRQIVAGLDLRAEP